MTIILLSFLLIGLWVWRIILSSPGQVGRVGERRVSRKLDWLPKEYRILNDILLKTPNGTTQIDHIVVSPYGIFIIETKNYKGWILGHENAMAQKVVQCQYASGTHTLAYFQGNSTRYRRRDQRETLTLTVPTISWSIISIAIVAIIATFAAIQEGHSIIHKIDTV